MELGSLKDYVGLILVQDRLQIVSRFYKFDSYCLEGGQLLIFNSGLTSMEKLLFFCAPSIKHVTSVTRLLSDMAAKAALNIRA